MAGALYALAAIYSPQPQFIRVAAEAPAEQSAPDRPAAESVAASARHAFGRVSVASAALARSWLAAARKESPESLAAIVPAAGPIAPVPVPSPPKAMAPQSGGGEARLSAATGVAPLLGFRPVAFKVALPGYDLKQVRLGNDDVPHAYLPTLPAALEQFESAQLRKTAFIKVMLPLILRSNAEILEQRTRVRDLLGRLDDGDFIAEGEQLWLRRVAEGYDVELPDSLSDLREETAAILLRRVDVVPPSLALAQGAEESGWGTSRFAREGNAVYGQWSWREGSGLVPLQRDEDKNHEVRKFDSLQASVDTYMRNLNTHFVYREFRERRAWLRHLGMRPTGDDLADTMAGYSERGEDYIETLRVIMRVNRLAELDDARLKRPIAGSQVPRL